MTLTIAESPRSLSVGTSFAADSLQPPAVTPPSFPSWRLFSSTYSRSCCLTDSRIPSFPCKAKPLAGLEPEAEGPRTCCPPVLLLDTVPFWGLNLRLITAELLPSGQVSFPLFLILTHFPSLLGIMSPCKVAFWLRL